jgi:lysozyme family protein
MKGNFDDAVTRVLNDEGDYVENPHDPGGVTKFGITLETLQSVRGPSALRSDIAALTQDDAKAIYADLYWSALRCDDLPRGVDYAAFDAAVMSGPHMAARWLQQAVGVSVDGVLGPATLAACRTHDAAKIIDQLCDQRVALFKTLPQFSEFGRGWLNRVDRVRRGAIAMASSSALQPSLPSKDQTMDQTQSLLQSRTVWSNIVGLASFILTITGHAGLLDVGQMTDSLMQIVTAGSFVASTIFRVISTKKVAL